MNNLVTNTDETSGYLGQDDGLIIELRAENTRLKEEIKQKEQAAAILEGFCNNTICAVVILDRAYHFVRVNEVYARAWSRDAADFPGRSFKFQPGDGLKEIFDQVVSSKASGKLTAQPFAFASLTEWRETYFDWTIAPALDAAGEVEFLICTAYEVTEHAIAHARLIESEERYRAIFEHSLDGIILSQPNGTILSANPAACSIFGCSAEEFCAVGWPEFLDPDDARDFAAVEESKQTFFAERGLIRKDGTKFTGELTVNFFNNRHGLVLSSMMVRDITERKKTETALRLSEDKFFKAFHHNQTAMSITRLQDGVFIDVNERYAAAFGFNREEMLGKSVIELGIWADQAERQAMVQKLAAGSQISNQEYRFRSKSGETGYTVSSVNQVNIDGEKCLIASVIDVTEQKKVLADLRKTEALFNRIFYANPLLLAITTKNGTFLEVNETLLKTYDYTREEVLGFTVADINLYADINERAKYLAEIEEKGFVQNFATKYQTKSGEILDVLLCGVAIAWNNEQCIFTSINDITELRQYQKEVARLDRLNMVGEMAASIGHEIRNPMTTVRGFLQLLGSKERYAPDKEYMDLMLEELDRANGIITEYLTLAKNKTVELKKQSLNQKIRTILPLLQADAMKQDKYIKVELGEIPYVLIDRNEIKQLILNLVRNGLEAMSPGGALTIKTCQDGDEVVLAVQDQGTGIPPEVLEKIGTPFLTTKENGTGLGLAVCYSIAQRNKAQIEIETGATGTTFKVRFKV